MTNLLFAPQALGAVLSLTGLPGGGNKIQDRSPYGNHGSITGATWNRLPSGLWYLSFDGTDDVVEVADKPEFDTGAQVTVKLWYRTDTQQGDKALLVHDESDYKYLIWLNNDELYSFGRTSSGAFNCLWAGASILYNNVWHQVVLTFDKTLASNRLKLYFDSVQKAQANGYAEDLSAGDEGIIVGRFAASDFKGDIALPLVLNRALCALEIQNHFNQEKHLFGVW